MVHLGNTAEHVVRPRPLDDPFEPPVLKRTADALHTTIDALKQLQGTACVSLSSTATDLFVQSELLPICFEDGFTLDRLFGCIPMGIRYANNPGNTMPPPFQILHGALGRVTSLRNLLFSPCTCTDLFVLTKVIATKPACTQSIVSGASDHRH